MKPAVQMLLESVIANEDIFEKARSLYSLVHEHEMRLTEIAHLLDMETSYISHYLRLHKLPEIVSDGYYSKHVTASHLFIIARLDNEQNILDAYEKILSHNLTTAETEEYVREKLYGIKTEGDRISPIEEEQLLYELKKLFGQHSQIKITQTRIKTRLTIDIKGSMKKTTDQLHKAYRRLDRKPEE